MKRSIFEKLALTGVEIRKSEIHRTGRLEIQGRICIAVLSLKYARLKEQIDWKCPGRVSRWQS